VRPKKGEGGVVAPSVLLCEQITTVPKDCLDAAALGGPLSSARISDVERAVLRAIGVP
jgi:mRNA-degrading endonuclease toxin of MazEF toxin-antitoxin module